VNIRKTVTFEAAHNLPMYPSIHGHSYRVTVEIAGAVKENGTVSDFGLIERTIKERYDHKNLNDVLPIPTMEMLARDIGRTFDAYKVILERPTMGETVEWNNFEMIPKV
jgi:6-pyruvoyl-tetrahydropterin synthase